MKITIDGVPYDTERSEPICERFSERVDDFKIEQVQETVYKTEGGRYFSHTWRFHDSEECAELKEGRFDESVRTLTPEEVIIWLRTDGLARRFQEPSTAFFPIGGKSRISELSETITP